MVVKKKFDFVEPLVVEIFQNMWNLIWFKIGANFIVIKHNYNFLKCALLVLLVKPNGKCIILIMYICLQAF